MARFSARVILGLVMALSLAGGLGVTAAISSSTQPDHPTGSVTGTLYFGSNAPCAVVRVFNAAGQRVSHRHLCPGQFATRDFRFRLDPGRYVLKLTYDKTVPQNCSQKNTVRVRANHTTHTTFGPGCDGY